MKFQFLLLIASAISLLAFTDQTKLFSNAGEVTFTSDAPIELIKGRTTDIQAVLDTDSRSMAFKIPITSFEGFNSALQRQHFNDNFMESEKYPHATFSGKIVEDINFEKLGTYEVKAKGKLKIHGITQDRIIPGTLVVEENGISIQSKFDVSLDDHQIKIPKIMFKKIASEIYVDIKTSFKK